MIHTLPSASRRLRCRSRGFNFAEVLFAIMILGIGFIMVAAIFPVALTQTRLTGEEVVASTVSRGGINYFQQAGLTARSLPATDLLFQSPSSTGIWPNQVYRFPGPTGQTLDANGTRYFPGKMLSFRDNRLVPDIRDTIWRQVSGNLILPDDPRVAWVGMYRRGITYSGTANAAITTETKAAPDAYAHVVVIGVQIRNRSRYEPNRDLIRYNNAGAVADTPPALASNLLGSLEPQFVYVKLTEREANTAGGDTADTATFYTDGTGNTQLSEALATGGPFAEGAYLVISDDQIADDTTTAIFEPGQRNGRVFRLGNRRRDLGTGVWELAPDGDLAYVNPNGTVGDADDINENIPPRPVSTAPNVAPAGLPAWAFIVGRGLSDPALPNGSREGTAQDTGVYVSIVPAN